MRYDVRGKALWPAPAAVGRPSGPARARIVTRPLEPGMVLTVEPGIYIAKDYVKVSPEWRGIGVRIEDDILVTEGDPDNLTASIPKKPAELLAAVA